MGDWESVPPSARYTGVLTRGGWGWPVEGYGIWICIWIRQPIFHQTPPPPPPLLSGRSPLMGVGGGVAPQH